MVDMALDHADAVAREVRPAASERRADGERQDEAQGRVPAERRVGDEEDGETGDQEQQAPDLIG
jgi:hypothetical protein